MFRHEAVWRPAAVPLCGLSSGRAVKCFQCLVESQQASGCASSCTQYLHQWLEQHTAASALSWRNIPDDQSQQLLAVLLCRRNFTDTALGISLVILNSVVDLVSFSGILYSIYPPLFAALLAYSIGGTVGSVWLGKVGLQGMLVLHRKPGLLKSCTSRLALKAARWAAS